MLCQRCKACFFQENLTNRPALQWEPHHISVEKFECAAQHACYVCSIVWNSLSWANKLQLRHQPLPFVPTLFCTCDKAELSSSLTSKSQVIDIVCQVAEGLDVASRRFLILPFRGVAPRPLFACILPSVAHRL